MKFYKNELNQVVSQSFDREIKGVNYLTKGQIREYMNDLYDSSPDQTTIYCIRNYDGDLISKVPFEFMNEDELQELNSQTVRLGFNKGKKLSDLQTDIP